MGQALGHREAAGRWRLRLRKEASSIFKLAALPAVIILAAAACAPTNAPHTGRLPVIKGSDLPAPQSRTSPETFAGLESYLQNSPGRTSIAVLDTSRLLVYEHNADQRFELASVGKIYVLLSFLDKLSRENRDPTPDERELMATMIEESDNVAATKIWKLSGGPDGLAQFLASKYLPQVEPAPDGSWGSMRASALDLGLVLANLFQGRILDDKGTALALSLLSSVIDSQSWGVGVSEGSSDVVKTYLKNGWYPKETGWIVNSAGIVTARSGSYVLVVLTDSQPSFEEGIQNIEGAISLAREGLF